MNAIRTGTALGVPGDNRLALVHAFLPLGRGQMFYARLSPDTIDRYVTEEAQRSLDIDILAVPIRRRTHRFDPFVRGCP